MIGESKMKVGYNNKNLMKGGGDELSYREHKEGKELFDDSGYYTGNGHPAEAAARQVGRPNVSHYTKGTIEPIDFISSQGLNFNLGCAIKYITRCNYKGSKKQDLNKAIDYLSFELERLQ